MAHDIKPTHAYLEDKENPNPDFKCPSSSEIEPFVRNLKSKSVNKNGSKVLPTRPTTTRKRMGSVNKAKQKKRSRPSYKSSSDFHSDSDAPLEKRPPADRNTKINRLKARPRFGPMLSSTDEDYNSTDEDLLWIPSEIAILEGMIKYKSEKNIVNPISVDMDEFHEFIKKSVNFDITRVQLFKKVRSLKRKYVKNCSSDKDGKDFCIPEQKKGYELSKQIWSSNSEKNQISENINSVAASLLKLNYEKNQIPENVNSVAVSLPKLNAEKKLISENVNSVAADSLPKSNGKQIATTEGEKKIDSFWFSPEEIVKGGMELVVGSKRAEMEEKWKKLKEEEVMVYVERAEMEEKMKKLKEEELMVYVKRMELQRDQALLVLEAISSSGN